MNFASKFFLFLSFAIFIIACLIVYNWSIRRKHSRERFAFYSLRAFVGIITGFSTLLLARNYLFDLIELTLSFLQKDDSLSGIKIQPNDLYLSLDSAFAISSFFIIITFFLIVFLYNNWEHPISTRENELKELGKKSNIFKDYNYYRLHREKVLIYTPILNKKAEVFSPFEFDTRPWHVKAANLFNLLDQQFNVEERQWYGEHQCYLSEYGLEKTKIAILCLSRPYTLVDIERFIDFIKKKPNEFTRYIVAIKGKGQEEIKYYFEREIELRYEEGLLNQLIPIHRYKDFINQYFQMSTIDKDGVSLSDMYVPLQGHLRKIKNGKLVRDKAVSSVEDFILNWVKGNRSNNNEHLALLGNYGQGKTVLAHKIVYEILKNLKDYDRIPILIELRGLSPRNVDELGLFSYWANRFKAKSEALWELHAAGKLFIILDGFDEMDLVGDTELLFSHFSQIWSLARFPNAQILIIGRPTLFADDEERRMALGIQNNRLDLPYTKALYLNKLTYPQMVQVLRNVKDSTKQGILSAFSNADPNSSFIELCTRPSTLFQLSMVWDYELSNKKDQLNSATVIGSFIEKTYDRQQSKESNVLTSFERNYFIMGIALGMMMENGYTNQIGSFNLRRWVKELWDYYPKKLPPLKNATDSVKRFDYLPNRLKENQSPLETILTDVRAGGIFVQDLSGRDLFRFAHKSHLEFLVSSFYSTYVLENSQSHSSRMIINSISKALNFNHNKIILTPGVGQFTAELITSKIDLIDSNGEPLSVIGNERIYSNLLYNRLIPYSSFLLRQACYYTPRFTGWVTIHPYQKYYIIILLFTIVIIILTFSNATSPILQQLFSIVIFIFSLAWSYMLLNLIRNRVLEAKSVFFSNMVLYLKSSNLLSFNESIFSKNYKILLKSREGRGLSQIKLIVLALYISFSGGLLALYSFAMLMSFHGLGIFTGPSAVTLSVTLLMVFIYVVFKLWGDASQTNKTLGYLCFSTLGVTLSLLSILNFLSPIYTLVGLVILIICLLLIYQSYRKELKKMAD